MILLEYIDTRIVYVVARDVNAYGYLRVLRNLEKHRCISFITYFIFLSTSADTLYNTRRSR